MVDTIKQNIEDLKVLSPECELVLTHGGMASHFHVFQPEDNSVYVDVGGHIGEVALKATTLAKGLKLIVIEPNPIHVNQIAETLKGQDLIFVPMAAGHVDQARAFLYSFQEHGWGGSLDVDSPFRHLRGYPITASYEITIVTLDSIFAEAGVEPGFIKIDTDGFDNYVLQGLSSVPKGCKFHVEYHFNLNTCLLEMERLGIVPVRIEFWREFEAKTGAIHAEAR